MNKLTKDELEDLIGLTTNAFSNSKNQARVARERGNLNSAEFKSRLSERFLRIKEKLEEMEKELDNS